MIRHILSDYTGQTQEVAASVRTFGVGDRTQHAGPAASQRCVAALIYRGSSYGRQQALCRPGADSLGNTHSDMDSLTLGSGPQQSFLQQVLQRGVIQLGIGQQLLQLRAPSSTHLHAIGFHGPAPLRSATTRRNSRSGASLASSRDWQPTSLLRALRSTTQPITSTLRVGERSKSLDTANF